MRTCPKSGEAEMKDRIVCQVALFFLSIWAMTCSQAVYANPCLSNPKIFPPLKGDIECLSNGDQTWDHTFTNTSTDAYTPYILRTGTTLDGHHFKTYKVKLVNPAEVTSIVCMDGSNPDPVIRQQGTSVMIHYTCYN